MRLHRHFGEQRFQDQRSGHTGHDDEQDDGGEVDGIHHADVQTLLGHDQGHLAAGHHANTHLEGITPAEPADLGRQTAADDLGDQGHHHEAHAEQQDLRGQAADIGFQADAGEEDGSKQHIVADVHPALHIGGILQSAQDDARDVGTCDVCNAEVGLGNIGHGKAERHTDDGDALGVGVALVQPLHGEMGNDAHADGGGEEQHGVQQHLAQPCTGAGACSQHTGQHHDADDIIDNGGTDDGGAKEALQVAQLLQGSHGDGHAGGGHNGTDEEGAVELLAAQRREAVE